MSLTGCLETENIVTIEPAGPYASTDTQAALLPWMQLKKAEIRHRANPQQLSAGIPRAGG